RSRRKAQPNAVPAAKQTNMIAIVPGVIAGRSPVLVMSDRMPSNAPHAMTELAKTTLTGRFSESV
ncbi:MAG: hypothetical protein AAFQ16_01405, partial [Pseudomonadota bacterium]